MEDYNSASREELQKALLIEQIKLAKHNRSFIKSFASIATAILCSIAASIVFSLLINDFIENTAEELRAMQSERDALITELRSIESRIVYARRSLDAEMASSDAVDLRVDFKNCSNSICYLEAKSETSEAVIEAFGPCTGFFSFPGQIPDLGSNSCPPFPGFAESCDSQPSGTTCGIETLIGAGFEVGYWIRATIGDDATVRYVNIIPDRKID